MVSGSSAQFPELAGGREAPLVLSTANSHPEGSEDGRKWCSRSPEWIRFQLADGSLVPVRCGCPNKCDFCAYMAAVECGALILLDGLEEEGPPRVAVTLTTRDPNTPTETFRRDVELVIRAIRRRHPEALYFS